MRRHTRKSIEPGQTRLFCRSRSKLATAPDESSTTPLCCGMASARKVRRSPPCSGWTLLCAGPTHTAKCANALWNGAQCDCRLLMHVFHISTLSQRRHAMFASPSATRALALAPAHTPPLPHLQTHLHAPRNVAWPVW
eukprot:41572-Chlamydomonas_euryale.AAC.3